MSTAPHKALQLIKATAKQRRHRRLTPTLQGEIYYSMLMGFSLEQACDAAGVTQPMMRKWAKRGLADQEPYASFLWCVFWIVRNIDSLPWAELIHMWRGSSTITRATRKVIIRLDHRGRPRTFELVEATVTATKWKSWKRSEMRRCMRWLARWYPAEWGPPSRRRKRAKPNSSRSLLADCLR
jgi:hypothetical protein